MQTIIKAMIFLFKTLDRFVEWSRRQCDTDNTEQQIEANLHYIRNHQNLHAS